MAKRTAAMKKVKRSKLHVNVQVLGTTAGTGTRNHPYQLGRVRVLITNTPWGDRQDTRVVKDLIGQAAQATSGLSGRFTTFEPDGVRRYVVVLRATSGFTDADQADAIAQRFRDALQDLVGTANANIASASAASQAAAPQLRAVT